MQCIGCHKYTMQSWISYGFKTSVTCCFSLWEGHGNRWCCCTCICPNPCFVHICMNVQNDIKSITSKQKCFRPALLFILLDCSACTVENLEIWLFHVKWFEGKSYIINNLFELEHKTCRFLIWFFFFSSVSLWLKKEFFKQAWIFILFFWRKYLCNGYAMALVWLPVITCKVN